MSGIASGDSFIFNKSTLKCFIPPFPFLPLTYFNSITQGELTGIDSKYEVFGGQVLTHLLLFYRNKKSLPYNSRRRWKLRRNEYWTLELSSYNKKYHSDRDLWKVNYLTFELWLKSNDTNLMTEMKYSLIILILRV